MPETKIKAPRADITDRYHALVRRFPLRAIRDDDELDRAMTLIDELIDRDDLADDEQDYLEALSTFVERYESEQHPIPPASDAEMLRHLIESRGVTQATVAEDVGIAESTISAILAGKRGLNRRHVSKLAGYFTVSPAVFLAE